MLNYITADIKRILSKKSFYRFILICTILFEAVVYIGSSQGLDQVGYLSLVQALVSMMPLIMGIYIFSVVYMDDLRSKSIQSAIGFGFKRGEIILVKLMNTLILLMITFLSMFTVIFITALFYQVKLDGNGLMLILKGLGLGALNILLYSSISSVAAYGLQKTAASMTTFILLITNTVYFLLSLILQHDFVVDLVGDLSPYLPYRLLNTLSTNLYMSAPVKSSTIILILAYFIFSYVGATVLFKAKELEF